MNRNIVVVRNSVNNIYCNSSNNAITFFILASICDKEEQKIMEENNERKNEKINVGMDKVLG